MRNSFLLTVLVVLQLCSMPRGIRAENRISLPEGVYYHQFASHASGLTGGWTNPALLGLDRNIYIQYIGEYFDGRFGQNYGFALAGDNVGIAYRRIGSFNGNKYKEYIFSAGLELVPGLFGGGSYRYIKDGPDGWSGRHFWNLGFVMAKSARFSLAGLFSNLNRNRREGQKTDFEYLYSFTYQAMPGRLSFSVEALLSGDESISDADYRFGARYVLSRRVKSYASINDRDFFQLGLVFNLDDYLIGGQSRFDADAHHQGTSLYGVYTKRSLRALKSQ